MVYTVKTLAKISGVSIRTLHFYDEIGLLKPAYLGVNGYRYYGQEELLLLQQILFFRELGFELKAIEKILKRSDFDKIIALRSHQQVLKKNILRSQKLIKTIETTIDHLKGIKKMKDHDMYLGFSKDKQAEYEKYLIDRFGDNVKTTFAECDKNVQHWSKQDWESVKHLGNAINQELVKALLDRLQPHSHEVQTIIKKHYQWVCKFWKPDKKRYIELGQLYVEHPDFKKHFEKSHPDLALFAAEAMKVFAEKELI